MLPLLLQSVSSFHAAAALKTGVSLLAKEGLKQAAAKGVSALTSKTPNIFVLHDPLTNLLLSVEANAEERQELDTFFRSESFKAFLHTSILSLSTQTEAAINEQEESLDLLLAKLMPSHAVPFRKQLAHELVQYFSDCARRSWNVAVDGGLLDPAWASSQAALSVATKGLAQSFKNADELQKVSAKLLQESDSEARRYRQAVGNHFSKIRPQSWQGTEEAAVEDIYIEPRLSSGSTKRHHFGETGDVFIDFFRGVLLGNPGGGKSTFAGKLCYDLCTRHEELLISGRSLTPFFITLREYARFRKEHPCSIVEYLAVHAKTEMQIDIGTNFFELLLMSGRAIVIFDGLDELMETSERVNIRDTVELFATAYPAAAMLVTSREVGYEKAPLDKLLFEIFRLGEFDLMQVQEYARKWFALTRSGAEEDREKLLSAFLEESSLIPDIRSNPLMLGLLCNLYKQDGYLPKNRPDVYSRCADLLFTRWDRHRGITVQLPMENKLRSAMCYLAHWIYSDEKLAAGVPERRLIASTASYIGRWKEDPDDAIAVATEIVSFFKGRAWVFTDIGSDKEESLYQFTHRTFLEFFTAEQLVKSHPDAKSLFEYLYPRIVKREWDVVCQLAFQIHAKNTESHDLLGALLLTAIEEAEGLEQRLTVASFAARVLDLIYPTPRIRRRLVRSCFATSITDVTSAITDKSGVNMPKLVAEIVSSLVRSPREERKLNASEIEAAAVQLIPEGEPAQNELTNRFLVLEGLSLFLHAGSSVTVPQSSINFWDDVTRDAVATLRPTLAPLLPNEPRLALLSWTRKYVSTEQLIEWFGLAVLFRSVPYPLVGWFRFCVADLMLLGLLSEPGENEAVSTEELHMYAAESVKLIDYVLKTTFPIPIQLAEPRLQEGIHRLIDLREVRWPEEQSQKDAALLLVAIFAELQDVSVPDETPIDGKVLASLLDLASARSQEGRRTRALSFIEAECSSASLKVLLIDWVNGVFSFQKT